MKKVQTKVFTARPAAEVYDYLADFDNQAQWRFDVVSSTLQSGSKGVVGARYLQKVRQGRKEVDSEVEVTEATPSSEVAFRTVDDGPVTVSGAWHIQQADTGTEVVCDVSITARGALRLIEPLMGPQLRKTALRYEQDLSERLNSPSS